MQVLHETWLFLFLIKYFSNASVLTPRRSVVIVLSLGLLTLRHTKTFFFTLIVC